MERTLEAVPGSDYQVPQKFLTHSSWNHRPVMDRVARNADTLVGGEIGTGRYIAGFIEPRRSWHYSRSVRTELLRTTAFISGVAIKSSAAGSRTTAEMPDCECS